MILNELGMTTKKQKRMHVFALSAIHQAYNLNFGAQIVAKCLTPEI